MSGADFLDSNVLIYLFDREDPRRRRIAERLVEQAIETGTAVISHQVVQETLNVITRKIKPALTAREAQAALRDIFTPLWRVMPSPALYTRTLELQERYQYSFYDSLILAAALESGCTRLLTEDLQDGHRIEGLTIENPFKD
jgi:predicted nucleic acid-binding protein